jgi:hypothetical protein
MYGMQDAASKTPATQLPDASSVLRSSNDVNGILQAINHQQRINDLRSESLDSSE